MQILSCICRPRERINRPQTRRRRENNEESLEKMQTIKQNLNKAMELLEYLVRRERRKRDLVVCTPLSITRCNACAFC